MLQNLYCPAATELEICADTGTHFRSYEFLWNVIELTRSRFACASLNFFIEHHGKGYCDGAFGLQRHWVSQFARTKNIECLADMHAAIEAGAAGTMSLDPPPLGPAYYVKSFKPSPKTHIFKLDTSLCDIQIEYTYCIFFDRASDGHVRGWNFWYSDRVDKRTLGSSIGKLKAIKVPCKEDWRLSYRATQPEKNPLNVDLLKRRMAKQSAFIDSSGASRRTNFMQALLRREKQGAKQKAKYLRQKRALAINLEEGQDSRDSESESDE